jgi:hypothetical protein
LAAGPQALVILAKALKQLPAPLQMSPTTNTFPTTCNFSVGLSTPTPILLSEVTQRPELHSISDHECPLAGFEVYALIISE